MNIWDEIYAKGEWGEGSGSGSTVETTKRYVEVVNEILDKASGINNIIDVGCGVWDKWQLGLHLFRLAEWGYFTKPRKHCYAIEYLGVDASHSTIIKNRLYPHNLPNDIVHFQQMNLAESRYANPVRAEIVLIKDVLQHNSTESVWNILSNIKYDKVLVVTNDSVLDGVNRDCEDGGYRPIDLRLPPFNLKPTRVVDYPSSPHQKTILIFEK